MEAEKLRQWIADHGFNGGTFAEAVGVSRKTVVRWLGGDTAIPEDLEGRLEMLPRPAAKRRGRPADVPGAVETSAETKVVHLDPPTMPNPAFDPVKAGLKPGRVSNTEVPGVAAEWDLREPKPGWRRVPGGIRVVHASIPNPINYEPPEWAGWRGVITKDGRVFDCETGEEMRPYGLLPSEKPAQHRIVRVAPTDLMDEFDNE